MSARPFQVGDPVLIDGTVGTIWHIDGPNPDNEFNGDYATAYINWDEPNEAGADGTAVIMTPDLTASKYQHRALLLVVNGFATTPEDDGTEAESLAEVQVPAFPDVLVHGRSPVGAA